MEVFNTSYQGFDQMMLKVYNCLKHTGLKQSETKTLGSATLTHQYGTLMPLLGLRKLNYASLMTDLFWQLSGSSNVKSLGQFKKIWEPWADLSGNLQSSYGRYLRDFPCLDLGYVRPGENVGPQIDSKGRMHRDSISSALHTLVFNPETRRAYYPLSTPQMVCNSLQPNCVQAWGFSVGPNGFLTIKVYSRSTDYALGLPYNMLHFWYIGRILVNLAGHLRQDSFIKYAGIEFTTSNLHLYDGHEALLDSQGYGEQLPPTQPGYSMVMGTQLAKNLIIAHTPDYTMVSKAMLDWKNVEITPRQYNPMPAIKLPMTVNTRKPHYHAS